MVDTEVAGWKSCLPLPPGPNRLEQWKKKLGLCSGILVLFTEAYKAQFRTGSDLMSEAVAMWERIDNDPSFKVFILDPDMDGQSPQGLRFYLQDGEQQMNLENFKSFFNSQYL